MMFWAIAIFIFLVVFIDCALEAFITTVVLFILFALIVVAINNHEGPIIAISTYQGVFVFGLFGAIIYAIRSNLKYDQPTPEQRADLFAKHANKLKQDRAFLSSFLPSLNNLKIWKDVNK